MRIIIDEVTNGYAVELPTGYVNSGMWVFTTHEDVMDFINKMLPKTPKESLRDNIKSGVVKCNSSPLSE